MNRAIKRRRKNNKRGLIALGNALSKTYHKECPTCGKVFETDKPSMKYCSKKCKPSKKAKEK